MGDSGLLDEDAERFSLISFGVVDAAAVLLCMVAALFGLLTASLVAFDEPSLIVFFSKLMQEGGGFRRFPIAMSPKEVRRHEDSAAGFLQQQQNCI